MIVNNAYHLKKMKVELTDRCELNCTHCSSNATAGGDTTIDLDHCLEILDEAASMGLEEIAFSGGEPLLYADLEAVVSRAADHNMHVSVYTTGNVPRYAEIVESLRESGVHKLIFSIFSNDRTWHESVTRTPGSFDATCTAIRTARELGAECELHFVPLAMNYHEIEKIVELGRSLGAYKVSALRFVPQGRGEILRDQVLSPEQNIELRESILRLRRLDPNGIRTGSPYNFFMLKDQPQCKAGIDRLTILPDLTIVPCDAFKRIQAEDFAGDNAYSSLSTAGLSECWVNSSYLKAVREYLSTEFPEECKSCESLTICHSGCLAQKFLSNGDRRKSRDPDCLRGMVQPESDEGRNR